MISDQALPSSPSAVRSRFLEGMFEAMGESSASLGGPGTTLAATENRRGTGFVAAYQFGEVQHGAGRTVLWCDPAFADRIESLADPDQPLPDVDLRAWATKEGFEIVGQSVMKTLGDPYATVDVPGDAAAVRFDWSEHRHLDLMRALVDQADPDDLDEAEIDLDELDDLAVGLLDRHGSIGAYGSARAWGFERSFGDIGVLVAAGHRGRGWGTAVVSSLTNTMLAEGMLPLYRCDHVVNIGSDRLSAGLGFVPVTQLTAVRLGPSAGDD